MLKAGGGGEGRAGQGITCNELAPHLARVKMLPINSVTITGVGSNNDRQLVLQDLTRIYEHIMMIKQ